MRFAMKSTAHCVLFIGLSTFVTSCYYSSIGNHGGTAQEDAGDSGVQDADDAGGGNDTDSGVGDGSVEEPKPDKKCDSSGTQCISGLEVCINEVCQAINCSDSHKCDPITQYCVAGRQCVQRSCVGVSCTSTQECVQGVCTEKKCSQSATAGTEPLACAGEGQYCEKLTNTCADANCNTSVVCSGGPTCSNGRCNGCKQDSNCPAGQTCRTGECKSKSALGEACGKSADCLDATMECAAAPRSVCVKKDGETCQNDTDCLSTCVNSKCTFQQRSSGSLCSFDTQCPVDHVCLPSADPKLSGQLVCLKKEGLACMDGNECRSSVCDVKCQACVEGIDCNLGQGDCRGYKTICSEGRSVCQSTGAAGPDFTSCTDPNNALVDTCYSGECKMKITKRFLSIKTNFDLSNDIKYIIPSVKPSMDANIPIYVEITVENAGRVYATIRGEPAMKFIGLPKNSIIKLVNKGQIWGIGGNGGQGAGVNETDEVTQYSTDGTPGGHAIYTEHSLLIDNTAGDIRGGGGGGGGGGGIFEWLACVGQHTGQGIGGGGGGGAGVVPGIGGKGCDTPSTWFGVSEPGKPGSITGGGSGGLKFYTFLPGTDSCKLETHGGNGGWGGGWGETGQNGGNWDNSRSAGYLGKTVVNNGKGGAGGFAVYRANGASMQFISGKDGVGKEVKGNGVVKGSTDLPTP